MIAVQANRTDNEVISANQREINRLAACSQQERDDHYERGRKNAQNGITDMALAIAAKKAAGDDLSHLPARIVDMYLAIASGELIPELAGRLGSSQNNKWLLDYVYRLPTEVQEKIRKNERFEIAELDENEKPTLRHVLFDEMQKSQLDRMFVPSALPKKLRIASVTEQINGLREQQQLSRKPKSSKPLWEHVGKRGFIIHAPGGDVLLSIGDVKRMSKMIKD